MLLAAASGPEDAAMLGLPYVTASVASHRMKKAAVAVGSIPALNVVAHALS